MNLKIKEQIYKEVNESIFQNNKTLFDLIECNLIMKMICKNVSQYQHTVLELFGINKFIKYYEENLQGQRKVEMIDVKSLIRENQINPNINLSQFIERLTYRKYPLTRYENGIKSEHLIFTLGTNGNINSGNINRRNKAILIENFENYIMCEHYIDKVSNINDYDIIYTSGVSFRSIENYQEVLCFFDWDYAGLSYYFDLKKINPRCEFYVSDLYLKIANNCFRKRGYDKVFKGTHSISGRNRKYYTDNVDKVTEFLKSVKGTVEQEVFLCFDSEMNRVSNVSSKIEAALDGDSHKVKSEFVILEYMLGDDFFSKIVRKEQASTFIKELKKIYGKPTMFYKFHSMIDCFMPIKSDNKFGIHIKPDICHFIVDDVELYGFEHLIACIKYDLQFNKNIFDLYNLITIELNREQVNQLKSLNLKIKDPELKAVVISMLAVNKHQKEKEGEIMKDKILESVSDLEPSKKTVKLCDSKLRYITDMLVESDLVVRVADEKFYHLPLNFYREIYKAVRTMPEFKKLVQDDLNNRIKDCVISWKAKKRIKYDTILKQSEISKTNFVLSRMKGTTAEKSIMVDGKRKKHIMVDGRLVKHLMNEFKHDEDFKKRFL